MFSSPSRPRSNQVPRGLLSAFGFALVAGWGLAQGCGDGIPAIAPNAGGATGTPCQTNSQCQTDSICVNGTCTALSGVTVPDNDGGSNDGAPDSGNSGGQPDAGSVDYGPYCQACTASSPCPGTGNYCLDSQDGRTAFCGLLCTSSEFCPSGSACLNISGTSDMNCYPTSGTCGTTTGTPDAGRTGGRDAGTGSHDAGTPPACQQTWNNTFSSFFNNQCFNCHHHSGEDESWVIGNSSNVIFRIQYDSMPPGGGDTSEAPLIQAWINCGHP